MTNHHIIDKENWHRKNHFNFYQHFANPCFNLCIPVKAQRLYDYSRDTRTSFFQLALYAILRAANNTPELKQRIKNDDIVEYAEIAVMTPIMTPNDVFRQILCKNTSRFDEFSSRVTPEIAAAKSGTGSPLIMDNDDFFCASCLPWLHFSSITHAEYHSNSVVPTLTWGKLENGVIPVAGKFNHAFVDGIHASRFFNSVAEGFAEPESL